MNSRHLMRTIGTGSAFHPALRGAIEAAAAHAAGVAGDPVLIVRGVGMRISSEAVARLIYQKELGAEELSDIDGLTEHLAGLDVELVSGRTRAKLARRRARGLIDVTDGMLSEHARRPNDAVGFIAVVPDGGRQSDNDGVGCATATLVWLVANTARQADLVISPHSAPVVPWQEVVRQTWAAVSSMRQLAVVRPDRLARAQNVFQNILHDIALRPYSEVRIGQRTYDPRKQADAVLLALEGSNAATDVSDQAKLTLVGELKMLRDGRWHRGEEHLSYGMRFTRVVEGGVEVADDRSGRLERDPDFLPAFRAMARLAARLPLGADRRVEIIAIAGALAGARDKRNGRQLWATHLWPLLDDEERDSLVERIESALGDPLPAREAAQLRALTRRRSTQVELDRARRVASNRVRKVLERQALMDLRRGAKLVVKAGLAGVTELDGWHTPPTYSGPDDVVGHWRFGLPCGNPDDLGLDADVWQRLLDDAATVTSGERLPAEVTPTGRSATDRDRLPLAGLTWADDVTHFKLVPGNDGRSYRVLQATDEQLGPRCGWTYADHIATLQAIPLHELVSGALEAGDDGHHLVTPTAGMVTPQEPDRTAVDAQDAATETKQAAQAEFNKALAALGELAPETDAHLEAKERLNTLGRELRDAKEALIIAEANVSGPALAPAPVPKSVQIDTVRALALGLRRARPAAPRVLATAARLSLNEGGLTLTFADDRDADRAVRVQVRPPVHVNGSDAILDCPTATIFNTYRTTGSRSLSLGLGRSVLVQRLLGRLDWADIASARGTKLSSTIRSAHAWLKANGMDAGCADALISMPPVLPGAAYLTARLTDETPPDLDPPYADVLSRSYLRPATWARQVGWLRWDARLLQHVADLLEARKGSATVAALAAAVPGLRETDLRRLLNRAGEGVACWVAPFLLEDQGRVVRLIACPHRGCNGWASVVCPVPEVLVTGHAVICASCRRVPDLDYTELFYPAAYVRRDQTWTRTGTFSIGKPDTHPATVARRTVTAADVDGLAGTITRSEVARLLSVPLSVVEEWSQSQHIVTVLANGRREIPLEELDQVRRLAARWRRQNGVVKGRRLPPAPTAESGRTFLSTRDAARRLAVSEPTVHRFAEAGLLTPHPHGARILWDPAEVDALIHKVSEDLGRPLESLDGLITAAQAAKQLGIEQSTLTRTLGSSGTLAVSRLGRRVLVHPADVTHLDERVVEALQDGLTVEAAKRRCGRSSEVIIRAIDTGALPAVRFDGGHYRILPADLDTWHQACMICDLCGSATSGPRLRYCDAHRDRQNREHWKREQRRRSRQCQAEGCDQPPRAIVGRGRRPDYCEDHARS